MSDKTLRIFGWTLVAFCFCMVFVNGYYVAQPDNQYVFLNALAAIASMIGCFSLAAVLASF